MPDLIAVDWGTSRVRAYLMREGAVVDRVSSDEGVSRLRAGDHASVFERLCGAWLAAEPGLPVVLCGMVGSREGWFPAPYAECPAGPAEIAAGALPVELGGRGFVLPGAVCRERGGVDVMRGEETLLLGSGVADGLVCLPGTHCKWAEIRAGRIARFATFMTGEMHALLREHSMIGRPASEPADPAGFSRGLDESGLGRGNAEPASLLNLLFRARAATVTGALAPGALGPYLSGLLIGDEVAAALRMLGPAARVTIVADPPRAADYIEALGRCGVEGIVVGPERTLLAGVARIRAELGCA